MPGGRSVPGERKSWLRAGLGPGLGAVLLLAGGLGWWTAPSVGAGPEDDASREDEKGRVEAHGGGQDAGRPAAPLPGGESLAQARTNSRNRQPLTDAQREARRFGRYDRDRNGAVSRDEFLASRRRTFSRLDRDGDGRLSFEEYAASTIARFATADGNADRTLDRTEFAATATRRSSTGGSAGGIAGRGVAGGGATGGGAAGGGASP